MDKLRAEQRSAGTVRGLREVQETVSVLAREYSLELLLELHDRGWSTASEVARELGMHVATAMRKLAELEALRLLEKRTREGGDLVEYRLVAPRLEIVLDFAAEEKATGEGAWERARRVLVREKRGNHVLAEADEGQQRVRRLVFFRGRRWRTAAEKLELSEEEGRFLWHLPFGSEPARSVAEACRRAGIDSPHRVARILDFVVELERLGFAEVVR